jgi:hypothetical protein
MSSKDTDNETNAQCAALTASVLTAVATILAVDSIVDFDTLTP